MYMTSITWGNNYVEIGTTSRLNYYCLIGY